MSLRISLRDGERVIVNGAVLRASGRADVYVDTKAAILRGRDVMRAADATTPARRLYFACMGAYTDADNAVAHQDRIVDELASVMSLSTSVPAKAACAAFAHRVATGDYYRALADCRTLMSIETSAGDGAQA